MNIKLAEEEIICDNCKNSVPKQAINILENFDNGKFCDACVEKCDSCYELFPITQIKRIYRRDYCNQCFDELFTECPYCGKIVEKDEIIRSRHNRRGNLVGCHNCCESCNDCGRAVDKDYIYCEDGNCYCEDCHSERFTSCEECNETISRDDAIYSESLGADLCEFCYNKTLETCFECDKEMQEDESYDFGGNTFCQKCYEEIPKKEFPELISDFNNFTYTKKDKYLKQLLKLVPIQIKDLKSKYPSLASGVNDLFKFCQGKKITQEIIKEYRDSLRPEIFPVEYTAWGGIQRSLDKSEFKNEKPQLVMNILASKEINAKLNSNPVLKDLFNKINLLSKKSTHPVIDNQIGWIRIDIAPDNSYLLIDEIQSDHQNAAASLKLNQGEDLKKVRLQLKYNYNLDDEGLNNLLNQYALALKDFPNIAIEAVSKFAKTKGIPKIFYHTYEGGMALKENNPPKSLYTKLPLDHLFKPSTEKPFNLEQEFLEREANKAAIFFKEARTLLLKYKSNI